MNLNRVDWVDPYASYDAVRERPDPSEYLDHYTCPNCEVGGYAEPGSVCPECRGRLVLDE